MEEDEENQNPEMEEIKRGFELFDVDNTGKIKPSDLLETMSAMNMKERSPVIYSIVEDLNTSEIEENGGVTYEEFIKFVDEKMRDVKSKEGVKRIFDFFNNDPNSDTLPLATIVKIAKELREDATEQELKELLKQSECIGNEITLEEFYEIMKVSDYLDLI